jgi:hypothetical protein
LFVIAYDFEKADGDYGWEEIVFTGVVAFAFIASAFCSADQIGAYDKLELLPNTEPVAGVVIAPSAAHYYRIYFDDIGCYEVLATGFVAPPG